jgi:hypothetical protein
MRWLPAAWMDELVPPPHVEPSDFIRGPVGNEWLIAPPPEDGSWADEEHCRMWVSPGETVEFKALREWPDITVTIGADGEVVWHDPIPDGATLFCIAGDPETAADTIKNALDGYDYSGDTVDIACYDWSRSARFRLVVDGTEARFEQVEEAEGNG